MNPEPPSVALLTWCSPAGRYAGAEVVRRLAAGWPPERLRWFGCNGRADAAWHYEVFAPRPLHWRIRGGLLEQIWWNEVEAPRLARALAARLQRDRVESLWVFPEMLATRMGLLLARRTGLPLHATFHDAPETTGQGGMPWAYRPRARHWIRQLGRHCASVDVVSPELVAHLRERGWIGPACRTAVVAPAMEAALGRAPQPRGGWTVSSPRRIGLCGSYRGSAMQWQRLLDAVGKLPHAVEILCWTPMEGLPAGQPARNTRLRPQPYADGDAALIDAFRTAEVDVGYLSLDGSRRGACFARTSLSSKLVAYAAAGLPVLVDAPPDAVIARLIAAYHAGVGLDGAAGVPGMAALLSDPLLWQSCAEGAATLFREHFTMEPNIQRLMRLMVGDNGAAQT